MLRVAFGEQKVGRMQLFEWFAKFKNGATSSENAKCLGYPLTSKKRDENEKQVRNLSSKTESL
jgi:hypothetical protein